MLTDIIIVRTTITRSTLQTMAEQSFGDLVKATVDIDRAMLAIGGELHADEEQQLLEDGSRQQDLWGINLYPTRVDASWIEYDSMINVRPSQGNRSRGIEDPQIRERIRLIVEQRVTQ